MASSAPLEIASTIQTASIERNPSPHHDLNPSTAASKKEPVRLDSEDVDSDVAEDEIPVSVLRPSPRKKTLPPLPDLRFEQSYLKSIEKADGWMAVSWITIRDQMFLPLVQGTLWTLALSGWRYWNRSTQFSGRSVGARMRRWWWGVNNWAIPSEKEHRLNQQKMAGDVKEFYENEFSSAGSD